MNIRRTPFFVAVAAALATLCRALAGAAEPPASPASTNSPPHTGPQTDGHFQKVILDEDQTVDGKNVDSLKDPMELARLRGKQVEEM